jgi:threonine dehydrogenase-like Zn-dependent dehydrogenase
LVTALAEVNDAAPASGDRPLALSSGDLGADGVVDPATDDVAAALREMTDGLGAAGAIEAVVAASAFQGALRSTRPDGTVVLVGHHFRPLELRSGSLIFSTGSSKTAACPCRIRGKKVLVRLGAPA